MSALRCIALTAGLAAAFIPFIHAASDWPQWRGPLRNGVIPDSPPLAGQWPDDGPKLLWESDPIPANDEGGHGSPVVVGDRVFLSVVWHEDIPSETRTITDLVLRKMGYQNPGGLGKEVVAEMEKTRLSLSPQLRGSKLDEFIDTWIKEHLNKRQQDTMSGFVRGRFKKGKFAIPLEDYAKMNAVVDKPFPSDAAFKKWIEEQAFNDVAKEELLKSVPPTKRVAQDTVICLDLNTGKTLWKATAPGEPRGRNCSSTAAVMDGRVFAMGSTHLYAVSANDGKILWSQPLPSKAPGSSVLAVNGAVVINAGKLTAYDAATGKELWQQAKIGGGNGSPVAWQAGGKTVVIINARNELAGIDLKSGDVLWTTPGGGDATPAIVDDILTVQVKSSQLGLVAFKLRPGSVEKLWNFPIEATRTQSSPIIHQGNVYLMDDKMHYCFSLSSGEVRWKQSSPSAITSPVLVDGKIFVLTHNGTSITMLKASPEERVELGKATVRALWVPSPTIAGGRLLVRTDKGLKCYDLTEGGKLSAAGKS